MLPPPRPGVRHLTPPGGGQRSDQQHQIPLISRLDEVDPDWRGEEVKDPAATGWVSVSCPRPEESSIQEDMKTLWDRVKERN